MDPGLLNCLNGPGKPLVDLAVKTPGSILGSGEIFERSLLACVFGWQLAILREPIAATVAAAPQPSSAPIGSLVRAVSQGQLAEIGKTEGVARGDGPSLKILNLECF